MTSSMATADASTSGAEKLSRRAWGVLLVLCGALVLAVVTAVNHAATGPGSSPRALLDGFHAAAIVSLAAVVLGATAVALGTGRRAARATQPLAAEKEA
jgi:hypothetical protein